MGLRCVYISGICLYTPWDLGVHTDMTRSTRLLILTSTRLLILIKNGMEWKRILYMVGNASFCLCTLFNESTSDGYKYVWKLTEIKNRKVNTMFHRNIVPHIWAQFGSYTLDDKSCKRVLIKMRLNYFENITRFSTDRWFRSTKWKFVQQKAKNYWRSYPNQLATGRDP